MGRYLMRSKQIWLTLFPLIFFTEILGYAHYYLDMDKLCSYNYKTKVIEIGKDEKSGAIVEDLTYFSTLSGKYPFHCKFRVESTFSMGIFAVIQNMNFRKNRQTGECIDYVQFRHSDAFKIYGVDITWKSSNLTWGEKHCGFVDASQLDISEIDPTNVNSKVPHAFIDSKGKTEVKIYVANETLTPSDNIDLKIVFTSYYICSHNLGNYKKCGADGCIWHQYFNDGLVNCPFISCADEGGCSIYYDSGGGLKPSTGLATKVMVGAVAGVFTMFIVFIAFLWLIRHCSICLNNPTPNSNNNSSRPLQMRPVSTVEQEIQPSAPSRRSSIDKDLPPSYESLFPADIHP